MSSILPNAIPRGAVPPVPEPKAGGFRLLRYFMATTLVAFAAVGAALVWLHVNEERAFEQTQADQSALIAGTQSALSRQHEEATRLSLLEVHEAAHVTLTRLMANLMWAPDLAPFVAAAERLPFEHCRAMPAADATGKAERKSCFSALGAQIMALPSFEPLDRKAYGAMQGSTVFKIKVFDRRGITIYSSEHAQIGEYAADNPGWRRAAAGEPASELTHRDRFSAFERVVENRDLISTYLPVRRGPAGEVAGVFEIYSDVTPFLQQTREAAKAFGAIAAANGERVEQAARASREQVYARSERFLAAVGVLLALLYLASLLIVRNGQRLIDRQRQLQAQAAQREQLWHREKMAALATMSANVAHEVGNPLAVIAGLAQELNEPEEPRGQGPARASAAILEQTTRIAAMMRRIADFARARSGSPECVEVEPIVRSVCEFLSFDQRLRGSPIEFTSGGALPALVLVPDHLNEVLMSLLQIFAEAGAQRGARARVAVHAEAHGEEVLIRIGCQQAPPGGGGLPQPDDPVLDGVRHRLAEMGARLAGDRGAFEITLPPACPGAAA